MLSDLVARWSRGASHSRAQQQLAAAFRELTAGVGLLNGHGPRVGIATFGSGCWHLGLEALLAHALALRGAAPELLICDMPTLPACDERTIGSRSRDRCDGCVDDKRALLAAARLPWRALSRFVRPESLAEARARVAALGDDALESHVERGWPIGQWLHVSSCHYLRADARGMTAERIDTRRRFLIAAIVVLEGVERWLDDRRPQIVIAESGVHFMWRIARELARARGIQVVCREIGKGGFDHHLYSLDADCMAPRLDDEWRDVGQVPLTPEQEAAVGAFLADLPARTYEGHADRGLEMASRQALGIPGYRKIAMAFSNVTWDLATSGRDVGFTGVLDWAHACVTALADQPGCHLVVRVHPAEARVWTREHLADQLRAAWPSGLPANITIVGPEQPISALSLCRMADLTLVYNSTAGLEAAADGHRVVVAGAPHFRDRGFTIDIDSREELREFLASWAVDPSVPAPEVSRHRARRYAHLFYLRYHMRMRWTTSPLSPPFELRIRSLDELQPGANPAVDAVCAGILNGHQPLLPRADIRDSGWVA